VCLDVATLHDVFSGLQGSKIVALHHPRLRGGGSRSGDLGAILAWCSASKGQARDGASSGEVERDIHNQVSGQESPVKYRSLSLSHSM
jgi:hypothetical protein